MGNTYGGDDANFMLPIWKMLQRLPGQS